MNMTLLPMSASAKGHPLQFGLNEPWQAGNCFMPTNGKPYNVNGNETTMFINLLFDFPQLPTPQIKLFQ